MRGFQSALFLALLCPQPSTTLPSLSPTHLGLRVGHPGGPLTSSLGNPPLTASCPGSSLLPAGPQASSEVEQKAGIPSRSPKSTKGADP